MQRAVAIRSLTSLGPCLAAGLTTCAALLRSAECGDSAASVHPYQQTDGIRAAESATVGYLTVVKTGFLEQRHLPLRIIPTGAFAGDILVADSSAAILTDGTNVLKTYTLPGNGGGDFALNLDPDGTDFWTGDSTSGDIWEVNITTAAIEEQFASGSASLFGLSVFGEITSGGGGNGVPEPTSMALLGAASAGFGALRRKRKTV